MNKFALAATIAIALYMIFMFSDLQRRPGFLLLALILLSIAIVNIRKKDDEIGDISENERKGKKEQRILQRENKATEKEIQKRRCTPICKPSKCQLSDFERIVIDQVKRVKRVSNVTIVGTDVTCTVRSNTGLTDWKFTIDFNDYGNLIGGYWIESENQESLIPEVVAKRVQSALMEEFDVS